MKNKGYTVSFGTVEFISGLKMIGFSNNKGYNIFIKKDLHINVYHKPFNIYIRQAKYVTNKFTSYKQAYEHILERIK